MFRRAKKRKDSIRITTYGVGEGLFIRSGLIFAAVMESENVDGGGGEKGHCIYPLLAYGGGQGQVYRPMILKLTLFLEYTPHKN